MKEQTAENDNLTKLADALSFLCSEKRTGKLLIRDGGKEGELFLSDGQITHAHVGRCTGLQALFFMLAWEKGTYTFAPKETADHRSILLETDRVLSLIAQRVHEWRALNETNPLNLNAILCLLPQPSGTIKLKKEEWDILAKIDGRRSLKDLSDEMYMAPLDLFKVIQRFREAGLVGDDSRYQGTARPLLERNFLNALEQELKLAVGAMAPILLEDALKDLEEATESLMEDKVEILLQRLSDAIPQEENRLRFQQAARILAFESSGNEELSLQEDDGQEAQ